MGDSEAEVDDLGFTPVGTKPKESHHQVQKIPGSSGDSANQASKKTHSLTQTTLMTRSQKARLEKEGAGVTGITRLTSQPSPSETPNFIHANRFDPIAPTDNNQQEMEVIEVKERQIKPPPIFIHGNTNIVKLQSTIESGIGNKNFLCRSRSRDIAIYLENVADYRKLTKFLQAKKCDFHTFQIQEDKPFRVVIRGLHHTTPPAAIKEELEELGHKVRSVTNIQKTSPYNEDNQAVNFTTKQPMPLFFVDLELQANNKDIFLVNKIYYTKVTVEEPYKKRHIPQCKRCQEFGHTKAYCNHQPRCVKCADDENVHSTEECRKPRGNPICPNCGGAHPANYKGCITYQDLLRLRRGEPSATRQPDQQTQQPSLRTRRSSISYARIAGPSQPHPTQPHPTFIPPPPSTNDITTLLTSFLNDFKSLINPLITLLTSVVGELLPRLSRP